MKRVNSPVWERSRAASHRRPRAWWGTGLASQMRRYVRRPLESTAVGGMLRLVEGETSHVDTVSHDCGEWCQKLM